MGNWATRSWSSLVNSDLFYAEKRKREDDEDEDAQLGRLKRRKLRYVSSPKYIYRELFEQGVYSDIKIVALDKKWNLHRVHLKQCPYFASMLSGAWKETNQDVIAIEIVDPNITVAALDAVFGSLYLDEIELDRLNIVSILGAASHFRMDKLAERCGDVMIAEMNSHSALKYHNIAEQYGLQKLKKAAIEYIVGHIVLSNRLWSILPNISVELMTEIILHPHLAVPHSEQNTYILALKWLYRCTSGINEKKRSDSDIITYFGNLPGPEYLLKEEGIKYQPAFKAINLQAVLITHISVGMLLKNKVIPHTWINEAVMKNYLNFLRANEGTDLGPTEEDIPELNKSGIRMGKYLKAPGTWRTTGSTCGVLLSWTFSNDVLEVSRVRGGNAADLISNVQTRRVIIGLSFIRGGGKPRIVIPPRLFDLVLGQKVTICHLLEPITWPCMIQIRLLFSSIEKNEAELSPA